MRIFKRSPAALVAVLAIVNAAGCTLERKQPIPVGYIGSLSGKYSTMGSPALDGAVLAVEQVNASGGISGRPLKLVVWDDEGVPANAAQIARELSDEGVQYVVGPLTTASGIAVLPVVNNRQILTIAPTTSGQELENGDDYFIRLCSSGSDFGRSIAETAVRMGLHSIVSLTDKNNESFCVDFLAGFRDRWQGDRTLIEIQFQGEIIYAEIAENALSLHPDGVVFCTSSMDAALLSQHLRKREPSLRLFSSSWAISPSLIENGGEAVDELIFYSDMDYGGRMKSYLEFAEAFRNRFAYRPAVPSILNYEAVVILAEALRENGDAGAQMIRNHILSRGSIDGLQSTIALDREGDAHRNLFPHVIRGGSMTRLSGE